ncbi:MAG: aminomethyl-transferring glycine dehydrogenase subunit GcvPB [Candidatus Hydrothermia bacterium]|nr:aminomethyl-transferring glycine dehydrogenase subunit GcvPB [Candidatus Hydrothermae bacterium]MDD3649225.1 aminomethyl-transferring glycine dehydrogenase subunit GcvPB [Candidatus Hydrothermia bacterium]MDD5572429.1 aminomethyl-transferring glycine dehydrogenase subunit GcvPB [Candidatus Hydrothermia bacterium]HOK22640.1 aminomethyl-transferring glycine dehydrogenase subunit GcvPB [Candidatus Hydrothermia bacterium]HOL23349.1 aminomethyl-transferring glycine dehydrogenase subunit GcvPB [Ca
MELIYEISKPGRVGYTVKKFDRETEIKIPQKMLRKTEPDLPEVPENEVVRHFVKLSTLNHHVDKGFYPLGSCTMKYNPKVNEYTSGLPGFTHIHPFQPEYTVQGALKLMKELEDLLAEISGMDYVSLQPAAGAHGEYTGIKIIRKYHETNGDPRKFILVPDSAHGTNPASTTLSGYQAITIKSGPDGRIDIEDLKKHLNEDVAGFMVTNPNTLGIFENRIREIADLVHRAGALIYMDGANLNAFMGHIRPGDIGCDVMHFNLHKTFSTPHGGGGPGSGPVGVKKSLEPYLPIPRIVEKDGKYRFDYDKPLSIGKIHSFYGNFLVLIRAYTYIRMLGKEHLKKVSEDAVINANYLREKLMYHYELPYTSTCMHEFVLSGKTFKKYGVRTLDIAKRILDFGMHAPTVYFPLIVSEALMIEPTETETKETLDKFAEVMLKIKEEAETNPDILKTAPHTTPVKRLDDTLAAKLAKVRYSKA